MMCQMDYYIWDMSLKFIRISLYKIFVFVSITTCFFEWIVTFEFWIDLGFFEWVFYWVLFWIDFVLG